MLQLKIFKFQFINLKLIYKTEIGIEINDSPLTDCE